MDIVFTEHEQRSAPRNMAHAKRRKSARATLQYEPEADVLAVEYARRTPIDHATEVGNLIVHFSRDDQPVLVEILNASRFAARAHTLTKRRVRRRMKTNA